MSNRARLVQNICGGVSKSAIAKIGLGYSLNCYPEVQNSESSCTIAMRTVSGQAEFCKVDGRCRGLYRVSRGLNNKPALYGVFGSTLYIFYTNGDAVKIADLDSNNGEVHMCETGGYGSAWPHLIMVDGTSVYAVNTGLSIGDQAADFKRIALPFRVNSKTEKIKPTHCAYLYGYLVVNDAGTDAFYTSYQYPFEIEDTEPPEFYEKRRDFIFWWNSLSEERQSDYKSGSIHDSYWDEYKEFIEGTADDTPEKNDIFRIYTIQFALYGFVTYSEWSPDNTTALISNGSKLYTFGDRSWQVFSYNDDADNPFSSPDNAAGQVGIKAPNSLAGIGRTVIWLGSSDVGENGVFMLEDTKLTRVSTNDIERELKEMKNPENAYSSIWQEHQHLFYSLTFEDSNKTFVYDVSEDSWHCRASYDPSSRLMFWRYNHLTFAYGKIFCAAFGALCTLDDNKFDEHDGRCILKLRRGAVLTSDAMPFFIDELKLIANQGQHSFQDQNKLKWDHFKDFNPRVSFRYSWDGSTFSDYEDAYLGKVGEYYYDTSIFGLGFGTFFTLEISTTENIPLAIENVLISWSPTSMMRY